MNRGGGTSAAAALFSAGSANGLAALGKALGESLTSALERRSTLVMGLDGELGTGKTTLVAAALAALGVQAPVTSPTYGLVHPYPARPRGSRKEIEVLHIDLYRLRHGAELDELGLPEEIADAVGNPCRVLLVEWFANARGRLGTADVSMTLRHADRGRTVRAQGNSRPGRDILRRLCEARHPDLESASEEVSY